MSTSGTALATKGKSRSITGNIGRQRGMIHHFFHVNGESLYQLVMTKW
jgi:hypothetical protein